MSQRSGMIFIIMAFILIHSISVDSARITLQNRMGKIGEEKKLSRRSVDMDDAVENWLARNLIDSRLLAEKRAGE